jgi:hypothetical protein
MQPLRISHQRKSAGLIRQEEFKAILNITGMDTCLQMSNKGDIKQYEC